MKKMIFCFLILFSCIGQSTMQVDDSITIYFARHGKTMLNTADRVQGWIDSPLTEQGIEVAEYLGAGLNDIEFDEFYTSDAGRQRETMSILLDAIGKRGTSVIEDKRLREAYFGSFEGGFNRDMADAAAKQLGLSDATALMQAMKEGKLTTEQVTNGIANADPAKQAETFLQIKARTQAALADIIKRAQQQQQKNILVVSSGTSIQALISDLTDDINKNKPLANATIVKLVYKNGVLVVEEIGNTSYIEKGKKKLADN